MLIFIEQKPSDFRSCFSSTDLTLTPVLAIKVYAHRFKIECMFWEVKQQVHGFNYHFWSSYLPKLNKYKKKSDPEPLSTVKKENQKSILLTVDAIECFVLCSKIARELIQLMALTPILFESG